MSIVYNGQVKIKNVNRTENLVRIVTDKGRQLRINRSIQAEGLFFSG